MKTQIQVVWLCLKDGDIVNLVDLLPHGSGIDGAWRLEANKQNIYAYNSYHCMNDNGYYDGWANFTIVFPFISKNYANDFKLHFQGDFAQRQNIKYLLREYLEDTFAYYLGKVESVFEFSE